MMAMMSMFEKLLQHPYFSSFHSRFFAAILLHRF
jgi:hypothetical protein